MVRSALLGVAIAGGLMLVVTDGLNAQSDPAAMVTERQDLMKGMGKSFGPLVAILRDESTDLVAAAAAAQTMNDNMTTAATLFPAGTAKSDVVGSRAKPEIWTQTDEFAAAATSLIEASSALVVAANSGDVETFKAAFPAVGQACGGCHEGKRGAGGKFRFPSEG